ncbi:hypothetical protein BK668_09005 [Pseudomonas fluorescens]|nr:hypothetical protein BK668_09005 [Pseudomonas fluorescens]
MLLVLSTVDCKFLLFISRLWKMLNPLYLSIANSMASFRCLLPLFLKLGLTKLIFMLILETIF